MNKFEEHRAAFYNSSVLYQHILEQKNESDFEMIIAAIQSYARGGNLLEYGCGVGLLSHLLERRGFNVTGVDISGRFVEAARQKYPESESLRFEVVSEIPLRFEDRAFDIVATSSVLEHCTHVDLILLEFARLLRSGGMLIIETPNILSPLGRMNLISGRIFGRRMKFHRYGTPKYFFLGIYYLLKKKLLRKAEFVYVQPDYSGFTEADEDVTYLSNPLDYLYFLRTHGFEVLALSHNKGWFRKFVSRYLPSIASGVTVVARKK